MRTPFQVIMTALLIILTGDAFLAQETKVSEKGPMLRLVFFLSNALAPDHPLLSSRVIFAGDLDGDGRDEIIGNRPQKQNVYLYTFKNGNLEVIDSIREEGSMFFGAAADIDGDTRREGIYYELMSDALVVMHRDPQGGISRTPFELSVNAQPDALTSGKFFDAKREVLVMDVLWKGEEETIYDDVVFFTWDGKGFRQGPKVRLTYNVMGLVAWDLTEDARDELLVLGDLAMEKCQLEVYGYAPAEGVKRLAQHALPLDGCLGARLIRLRALGRSFLLLVEGSKIYEVKLPAEKVTQPTLELRSTLHMDADSATAGDIDGDGNQELLIIASRSKLGPPDTGFFIYKFFSQ